MLVVNTNVLVTAAVATGIVLFNAVLAAVVIDIEIGVVAATVLVDGDIITDSEFENSVMKSIH